MNYWKTKNLAEQIKQGDLTESEKKNYYIATTVIAMAGMYLAIGEGTADGLATLAECIFIILITIFGINITFSTNQGNEGVDYIARVAILSLPILIKLFALAFIVGIIIGITVGAGGQLDNSIGQWPLVVFSVIVQMIYFWRLNVHLNYINT